MEKLIGINFVEVETTSSYGVTCEKCRGIRTIGHNGSETCINCLVGDGIKIYARNWRR